MLKQAKEDKFSAFSFISTLPAQSDEYLFDNVVKILDKYNSYKKDLFARDFDAQESEPCLRN